MAWLPSHPAALATAALALAAPGAEAEIVDRIAAIVGSQAITLSEVRADLRMESLLGLRAPGPLEERGPEILRRLVDRRLILQDVALTPFLLPDREDVEGLLQELRGQTFLDGMDFSAALAHYGLAEQDFREYFSDRLSFEGYVSFRFKTGLDVSAEDVAEYYREVHLPAVARSGEVAPPLEAVAPQIEAVLVEERANELLAERLLELRLMTRTKLLIFADGGER